MRCIHCGSDIQDTSKFCVRCGKKIPRCPTCGNAVLKRARFCKYDGTRLPEEILSCFPEETPKAAEFVPPVLPVVFEEETAAVPVAEVALEQTGEGFSMSRLIASHFMHGVVDGVQVQLLGQLGQFELAGGRAVLGVNAHFEVLLGGVGHDFAQQLCELRCVLGLFVSGLLPVQADLRITLAVRDTSHRQIHADLGALALEVLAETLNDLFRRALRNADDVLGSPGTLAAHLVKLAARHLAQRALFRGALTFMHITADRANKLLHIFFLPNVF